MQTEAASHLASLGFQKQKFWFVLGLNTNQRWKDKVDDKIPGSWHQLLPVVTSSSYSLLVRILLEHSWKHRARGQSRAAHLWCVTPHAWQTLVAHLTGSHSGTELDGCSSRCRGVGQLSRWVSFKKWASDVVPLKQCLPKKKALWLQFLSLGLYCWELIQSAENSRGFTEGPEFGIKQDILVSVAILFSHRTFKYLVSPK